MPFQLNRSIFFLGLLLPAMGQASVAELFAKGSASKNYVSAESFTTSITATAGLAITLIPRIRIEARYTNETSLQNQLMLATSSTSLLATNIRTQTNIYSLGLDIDILGDKSWFQPFIFVGAGYVSTTRSYYVSMPDGSNTQFVPDSPDQGISGNLGAGFRFMISHSLAFEIEVFSYILHATDPNRLINMSGSAGIRIFI